MRVLPAVRLLTQASEDAIKARRGGPVHPSDCAFMLSGDAAVYKANGAPLLVLLRGAIPPEQIAAAMPALVELRKYGSHNRGHYTGQERPDRLKRDGTVARSRETQWVPSALVGFFDRAPRTPFCRQTRFSAGEVEKWAGMQPMLRTSAALFKEVLPERYATQDAVARTVHPDFQIQGTPFSTLTVNHNVVSNLHMDKGDLADGFGCMVVVKEGSYDGFELVFPRYRCGVGMETGDLILFDPHELHANIPPRNASEGYHRTSIVMYFRAKMAECGSAQEEQERAKARGAIVLGDEGSRALSKDA